MADRSVIQQVEDDAAMYLLGALSAEDAARFEQRLAAGCALCVAELRSCESTVAALAASVAPVAPPAEIRHRLLDRISQMQPQPVMEVVRADEAGFIQTPMPGIQIRYLKGKNTFLVKMAPKSHLPAHEHKFNEQCLMLEGSVSGDGQTAYAGDFVFMPAGSLHKPLYSEEGCLFLITYS
ncbi:MAG TPA: cupin domain-containing protein [Terriglobales bacterium]|jgi:quercetin dioxygenase-like cupin family protein|nr:cupin domain-containing protein [Terriglobales bacterium]